MDWLGIRVLPLTPLRPEFEEILDELRAHPKDYGVRSDEHYAVKASLEQFGYPMRFFGWKKHKDPVRGQTHKLEFQKVGTLSMGAIHDDLGRIVTCNPDELEVMRTDLCADLKGVTVDDVNRRMRVRFKRSGRHFAEYAHIWKGAGDTFQHGGRGNCFRVYNKTAELESKYKKESRMLQKTAAPDLVMKAERYDKENKILQSAGYLSAELEPENAKQIRAQFRNQIALQKSRMPKPEVPIPSFYETYGLEVSDVLTRVEREMVSTKVPRALSTLGKLKKNLVDFDPFDPVEILKQSPRLPSRQGFSFAQYECGLRLRAMLEESGSLDYVRNHIKNHNPGNVARTMDIYMPFLETIETGTLVTREQMTERYRDSVSRQLAA